MIQSEYLKAIYFHVFLKTDSTLPSGSSVITALRLRVATITFKKLSFPLFSCYRKSPLQHRDSFKPLERHFLNHNFSKTTFSKEAIHFEIASLNFQISWASPSRTAETNCSFPVCYYSKAKCKLRNYWLPTVAIDFIWSYLSACWRTHKQQKNQLDKREESTKIVANISSLTES